MDVDPPVAPLLAANTAAPAQTGSLLRIAAAAVIIGIATSALAPAAMLQVERSYGVAWAGLVTGLVFAAYVVFTIPAGRLLDSHGAKLALRRSRLLVLAAAALIVSGILLSPVTIMLVVAAAIATVVRGSLDVALVAAPMQTTAPNARTWVGRMTGSTQIGFLGGAPLGVALVEQPVFLAAAAAGCFVVGAVLIPRHMQFDNWVRRRRESLRDATRQLFAIPGYLRLVGYAAIWNFTVGCVLLVLLPLVLADTGGLAGSGWMTLVCAAAIIVGLLLASRQLGRRELADQRVACVGSLAQMLGVGLLVLGGPLVTVGLVAFSAGNVTVAIGLSSGRALRAGPQLAGLATSVPKPLLAGMLALGGPAAGVLVDALGIPIAGSAVLAVFAALALLLWLGDRHDRTAR